MIRDHEAELVTDIGFDLGPVRPGPGNPIKFWATGVGAVLIFTMGVDAAEAEAGTVPCITVDATDDVEFELPSNTQQFIATTFGSGDVGAILPGAQTNT